MSSADIRVAATSSTSPFKDPITFEVFKNSLIAVADDMGLVTLRTAHSPILASAMDFSTAVCDEAGQVLAQGAGVVLHLGTIPAAMVELVRRFGGTFREGDVFIFNDTDEVAQHLPDHYVIRPFFWEGGLLGFGVCTTHHTDVGGRSPGSVDHTCTEIFQEGLQIPLVRLYEAGRRNEGVFDIMMRNSRTPAYYAGDLEGQLSALHTGEQALRQLVGRYGVPRYRDLCAELLDYTERLTRAEIAAIEDGEYEFEDWLDNDGVGSDPIPIRVKITVRGGDIEFDWAGTGPQVNTALNIHFANTRAVCFGALQGAFRSDIPSNQGFYRPITVRAPEGSIVNPRRPAARGARGVSVHRLLDTVLGALDRALPGRVPAASDGGPAFIAPSRVDNMGRTVFTHMGPWSAGWGGRPGADGIDGASPYSSNYAMIRIEEVEQQGVVQIDALTYVPDTGGAGQWRGCLSVAVDVRMLHDDITLSVRSLRGTILPYGLAGGRPGTATTNVMNPGAAGEKVLPLNFTIQPRQGDVFRHIHAGGGGYGDPLSREAGAVLEDVLNEKISPAYALSAYGVVVDMKTRTATRVRSVEVGT